MKTLLGSVIIFGLLNGCVSIFPKYCKEQTEFKFKEPVLVGWELDSSSIRFKQDKIPFFSQKLAYVGILKDSIEMGSRNRRYSSCVFKDDTTGLDIYIGKTNPCSIFKSKKSLQTSTRNLIPAFESQSYTDSISMEYFPVYFYNPGPHQRTLRYGSSIANSTYQVKTQIGWLNIDKTNSEQCGSGVHSVILEPNEVGIVLLLERTGNQMLKSRICLDNKCSEEFLTEIDLDEVFPLDKTDSLDYQYIEK